jgi:two-component system phosphate regulon sensor histidine kinase PhoR
MATSHRNLLILLIAPAALLVIYIVLLFLSVKPGLLAAGASGDAIGAAIRSLVVVALLVWAFIEAAAVILYLNVKARISKQVLSFAHAVELMAEGKVEEAVSLGKVDGETERFELALQSLGERIKHTEDVLSGEAARLSGILEGMFEGVLVVGGDGRVTLINTALKKYLVGRSPEIGKTVLDAVGSARLAVAVDVVLEGGSTTNFEVRLEGHTPKTFRVSIVPLDISGERGAIAVFHDVTELERLERVRKDFVANASHELRTPLAVISGAAETLIESPDISQKDKKRFLDSIRRQTERAIGTVEDLLTLCHFESGDATVAWESVDVEEVVNSVLTLSEMAAKERRIEIALDLGENLRALKMQKRALERVLLVLLENAIHYSPEGSEVVVSARTVNGETVFEVKDRGPGIPPEERDRIFERFYRTDSGRARKAGGTGLGLAIARHIVRTHGGIIGVEKRDGGGSIFRFSITNAV